MVLHIAHSEVSPGVVVLTLNGRVMLGPESAPIPDIVQQYVSQGKKHIIVDLAGVTHIDSTGIGRFIASLNYVYRAGGKLLMAGAVAQVRDGFRVTRLDTVFPFYDTLDDARASLTGLPV
ncbi:MAG: STAS domain-containing protein [Bryobacteraceae bacterium]|nr:STAS domain-containing protein [Bryobacteraceae bacterium]